MTDHLITDPDEQYALLERLAKQLGVPIMFAGALLDEFENDKSSDGRVLN